MILDMVVFNKSKIEGNMIVTIYISSIGHDTVNEFENGINLEFFRVGNSEEIVIKLVDDADKKILGEFSVEFEELYDAMNKLKSI